VFTGIFRTLTNNTTLNFSSSLWQISQTAYTNGKRGEERGKHAMRVWYSINSIDVKINDATRNEKLKHSGYSSGFLFQSAK